MNIWPPVFRDNPIPGMTEVEDLARAMFGAVVDGPHPPECVKRWAFLSVCRLHSDGIGKASEKLDAAIIEAAAEFASQSRSLQ